MNETPAEPTRRYVLGACVAACSGSLAGCVVAGAPDGCDSADPPPSGFELRNGDPEAYTVTIEIARDRLVDAPTVFEESYELGGGYDERTVRADDVVRYAGRYVITVRLGDDVEANHVWTVAPDRCDGVRISIEDGGIQFDEPGAIGLL